MTQPAELRISARCRVVIDNDWAGDPDGLVALAHHLLSPGNRVVAVTSSFLNPVFGPSEGTAEAGAELARELVELIGTPAPVQVHSGGSRPFDAAAEPSPAVAALVAEARRDDPLPLLVVCAGPLTNVAEALSLAPDTASRMTVVWVGGSLDATAYEYNRDTDQRAAELVFTVPALSIWQFPLETYRSCAYSVAELEHDLGAAGKLGHWLWNRFTSLPIPDFVQLSEVWALGDSPPVLVTALDDQSSRYTQPASGTEPGPRRVYTDVDFRLLVGDLSAKLRRYAAHSRESGTAAR